jgi:hypothetical protein
VVEVGVEIEAIGLWVLNIHEWALLTFPEDSPCGQDMLPGRNYQQ